MVWRNHYRVGRRKRERIAILQKQPTITAIETGQFLSGSTKRKLQRAAWRARHVNLSDEQNVEIIDLTQEPEETANPTNAIEQTESSAAVYTATVTQLFTKIVQQLLTMRYIKEKQISK